MAASLELHNTGDPGVGAEVRALVEHVLSDRPGDWRVSIVGSRADDEFSQAARNSREAYNLALEHPIFLEFR